MSPQLGLSFVLLRIDFGKGYFLIKMTSFLRFEFALPHHVLYVVLEVKSEKITV